MIVASFRGIFQIAYWIVFISFLGRLSDRVFDLFWIVFEHGKMEKNQVFLQVGFFEHVI